MTGRPLSPTLRAAIEAWAERNPHARQARAIRTLLDEIDRLTRRPAHPCPLTPKELDVLTGTENGETCATTGQRTGLSPHTVKVHRARIYRRLGVDTAAQAVAVAMAQGWLPATRIRITQGQNPPGKHRKARQS